MEYNESGMQVTSKCLWRCGAMTIEERIADYQRRTYDELMRKANGSSREREEAREIAKRNLMQAGIIDERCRLTPFYS